MIARVYVHPAGTDWQAGQPIAAEGVSMPVSAGASLPALNFACKRSEAPRPRLDQCTLVIDGHAVETVFTPLTRGTTMLADDDFTNSSVQCAGVIAHLDELASTTGWADTALSALGTAAAAHVAARPLFQSATGITAASFAGLSLLDTASAGTPGDPASVDRFGTELMQLWGAIGRYAVSNGMPLDWWMDATRVLRCASPLRPGAASIRELRAGHNADEITEGVSLPIGGLASSVTVGTIGNLSTATVPGIEGVYGTIERVAASGSSAAIVSAMSAQLATFGVSIGNDLATVDSGRPSVWIGDRVRVRNSDGDMADCAIVGATLSVNDGGDGVSISATAVEGDWL
jgi:hypothetical protein